MGDTPTDTRPIQEIYKVHHRDGLRFWHSKVDGGRYTDSQTHRQQDLISLLSLFLNKGSKLKQTTRKADEFFSLGKLFISIPHHNII
jgi:hypothetical protein